MVLGSQIPGGSLQQDAHECISKLTIFCENKQGICLSDVFVIYARTIVTHSRGIIGQLTINS